MPFNAPRGAITLLVGALAACEGYSPQDVVADNVCPLEQPVQVECSEDEDCRSDVDCDELQLVCNVILGLCELPPCDVSDDCTNGLTCIEGLCQGRTA